MSRSPLAPLCLALLASVGSLAQTTVYVSPGSAGAADGSSWENATADLPGAMASALPGTEIWVEQGAYAPTACSPCDMTDRQLSFQLRPGVTVIGGFLGNETSAEQADAARTTRLSGAIDGDVAPASNSLTVVTCDDCGDAAGLVNLEIAYGNADVGAGFSEGNSRGGGVLLIGTLGRDASPAFTDCVIRDNRALAGGGGVYLSTFGNTGAPGSGSPVFTSCEIRDNTSNDSGGGLYVAAGGVNSTTVLVQESRVAANRIQKLDNIPGGSGAGLFSSSGPGSTVDVRLRRTLIEDNAADPTLANGAENSGGNGGGIYVTGDASSVTTVAVENAVFRNNSSYAGAGMYVRKAVLTVRNSTIVANAALGAGGNGGGVYVNGGNASDGIGAAGEIYNSIIYGNTEVVAGNGSEVLNQVNSTVYIEHTLVDKAQCNSGVREDENDVANFESDDPSTLTCGPGMIFNRDPAFATGLPELTSSSPAIDAGANGEAPTGPDFLGNERIEVGPNGTAAVVDLGAFEFGAPALPVELVSFDAEPTGTEVEVAWAVGQEINFAGYRLERSEDGAVFAEVIFVPAMGNGDYRYADRAVIAGTTYYYRLASVDLDGSEVLSDVVAASVTGGDTPAAIATQVYPNPAANALVVNLPVRSDARTVYVSVLDSRGRRAALWPLTTDGLHQLDLSALTPGSYVVRLTEGSRIQTSALTIRR